MELWAFHTLNPDLCCVFSLKCVTQLQASEACRGSVLGAAAEWRGLMFEPLTADSDLVLCSATSESSLASSVYCPRFSDCWGEKKQFKVADLNIFRVLVSKWITTFILISYTLSSRLSILLSWESNKLLVHIWAFRFGNDWNKTVIIEQKPEKPVSFPLCVQFH